MTVLGGDDRSGYSRVVSTDAPAAFVGRDDDLAVLHTTLARCVDRVGVAVVTGEAGIGKTSLLDHLAEAALSVGDQVLRGACTVVFNEPIAYAPIAAALRGLRNSAPSATSLAPTRAELFERTLDQLAAARPAGHRQVLLLEDLHWSDAATLELIAFLARNLPAGHLIVFTRRDDEQVLDAAARYVLDNLEGDRHVVRVALSRLSARDTAALATAVLGRSPTEQENEALIARSGGNPFIAHELLSAQGLRGLPPRISDVLLARARGLDADAQHVVRAMAVLGREASADLLAGVTGFDPARAVQAAADGVRSGILVVSPDGAHFSFRHALSLDAVVARLVPGEREGLHADIARALSRSPDLQTSASAAAEWASHCYASGRRDDAYDAAISAATVASSMFAHDEAWRQIQRAVQLHRAGASSERFADLGASELLERAAQAARGAGHVEAAVELNREALAAATTNVDRARLCERLGRCLWDLGRMTAAQEILLEAAGYLDAEPRGPVHATVAASRARLAMVGGHYIEAVPLAQEAIALAEIADAPAERARALTTLGMARVHLGSPTDGLGAVRQGRAESERWGDAEDQRRAAGNLAFALLLCGHTREACDVAVSTLKTARRYSAIAGLGAALVGNTIVLLRLAGRWDEALRLSEDVLDAGVTEGLSLLVQLARAELDTARGDLVGAEHHLAAVAPLAGADASGAIVVDVALARAELAYQSGGLDDAAFAVAQALDVLAVEPQTRDEARACQLALRIQADRNGGGSSVPRARLLERADVDRLRARAAAAEASTSSPEVRAYALVAAAEHSRCGTDDDSQLWRAAATQWADMERPYERAYATFRLGEALVSSDRSAAVPELRRSADLARGLGASPLLARVEALCRRARITLPTEPTEVRGTAPGELTRREHDVLVELATGLTNRQIAERLYLSHRTVDVHVANILAKLHAANRTEAVTIAVRKGHMGR